MSYHFISAPTRALQGEIVIPGDKSISHRSLIFGAIAKGQTTVEGFLNGEDCLATLAAFRAMGVQIETLAEDKLLIHGVGKYGLQAPKKTIDCGNSGTSMRLLAGLLVGQSFNSILTGDSSLLKRPMARICEPLKQMGAHIQSHEGKAPLSIEGGFPLKGISYDLPEASAQVKSCLLLAGLYASGETCLKEPAPTRDHTEKMLKAFSYPYSQKEKTLYIIGGGELIGTALQVPGDLSSAAFFIVGATVVPGSSILLRNVGVNPTRTGILLILNKMGADISLLNHRFYGEEPVADILVRSSTLKGIDIPTEWVSLAIDEFPIIFIAAACAEGTTTLKGAKELRSKESDRLKAMVQGLTTLGIEVLATEDGAVIHGGHLQAGSIDSFHDHRIAMAFAVAGASASGPIRINDCEQVATSFPSFLTKASQLQFSIRDDYAN